MSAVPAAVVVRRHHDVDAYPLAKSMTNHADYRIGRDVYHTKTAKGGHKAYWKPTVIEDVLIVSFKEF